MRLVCHAPKGGKSAAIIFDPSSTLGDAAEHAAVALGLWTGGDTEAVWTFYADDGRRMLRPVDTFEKAGLHGGEHVHVGRIG